MKSKPHLKLPPGFPKTSLLPYLGLIIQEMTYRAQRKWGMPANVCMVLGHLKAFPEVCEPAAIAEAKRLPRQTVTFVLDTLEKKGLATRKQHPSDRRKKTVHLTAKGKALAERIMQDFLKVEKAAVNRMGKINMETVRNILESFGKALNDVNADEFETAKG